MLVSISLRRESNRTPASLCSPYSHGESDYRSLSRLIDRSRNTVITYRSANGVKKKKKKKKKEIWLLISSSKGKTGSCVPFHGEDNRRCAGNFLLPPPPPHPSGHATRSFTKSRIVCLATDRLRICIASGTLLRSDLHANCDFSPLSVAGERNWG